MKSLTHKLLAFTFIIALATGCASVTDAGLDTPADKPVVEQPAEPDSPGFGSDEEMNVIVDKPE